MCDLLQTTVRHLMSNVTATEPFHQGISKLLAGEYIEEYVAGIVDVEEKKGNCYNILNGLKAQGDMWHNGEHYKAWTNQDNKHETDTKESNGGAKDLSGDCGIMPICQVLPCFIAFPESHYNNCIQDNHRSSRNDDQAYDIVPRFDISLKVKIS